MKTNGPLSQKRTRELLPRRVRKLEAVRHSFVIVVLTLGLASISAAAVDSGLLAYVPSDSHLVSAVDLVRARASAFGLHVISRIDDEDDNFTRFIRDTGFDPRYDLSDFIFAGGDPDRFAILARGNFDPSRIASAAKSRGMTVENAAGIDLFIDRRNNPPTGFAFLAPGIVAMADLGTLKSIAADRSSSTTLNPTLALHISTFGSSHDAWFVSVDRPISVPKHFEFDSGDSGKAKALSSITTASGGIQFGSEVNLTFEAITRTADDAASLADMVRFVSSAVQLGRHSDTNAGIVASALDRMELTTERNNFRMALKLSERDVERLADIESKHVSKR